MLEFLSPSEYFYAMKFQLVWVKNTPLAVWLMEPHNVSNGFYL